MSIQWLQGYQMPGDEVDEKTPSLEKATDLNAHNGPSAWDEMDVHGKIHHGEKSTYDGGRGAMEYQGGD